MALIALRQTAIKTDQLRVCAFFTAAVLFSLIADTNGQQVSIMGHTLPTLCFFQRFVGIDCPGCGITRSLILAFDGHFVQSYFQHIWGIPLSLILLMQIPAKLLAALSIPLSIPFPIRGRWGNHFVFLSLLMPWVVKTAAVLYIQLR